jgi:hypothetical protein
MSFQDMAWAVDQKCASAGQKLVLLMLANYSNGHTGQCNPSHKRLAEDCSMGVSTLRRSIDGLQADGFLTVIHKSSEGVSLPNQYRLALHKLEGVGSNRRDPPSKSDGRVPPNRATNLEVKPRIEPIQTEPVGFASFYAVYPKKTAKPNAIKAFKSAKLKTGEIDSILTDIETRKQSDDWTKENGKYIPNPATYLNQRRWEDGETAHTSSYANVMAGAI